MLREPVTGEIEREAQTLANSDPEGVRQKIIRARADEIIAQRKALGLQAIAKIETYQKNLAGIKQAAMFDADGKPIVVGFTEGQNAQRQQLKDNISKLEDALREAFGEKANWKALEDAMA
jgi:hypothetical protein